MPPKIDSSLFDKVQRQLNWPMPPNFGSPPEDERDKARRIGSEQAILMFIGLGQVALLGVGAFMWWYLGGAMVPLSFGFLAGAVAAGGLFCSAWSYLEDEKQVQRFGLFWWFKWAGMVLFTIFVSGFVGGLLQRIWERLSLVLVLLLFPILSIIGYRSSDAGLRGRVEWFFVGSTLVFAPFFVAWSVASISWPSFTAQSSLSAWLARQTPGARAVLTARIDPKRCTQWTGNGEPIRVAVTLSGGGYRAAVIHAGFLASLDAQCVPIHFLSTVSGGSIIGASYALGVPPGQFAWQLAASQPGLPAEIIKIVSVISDLVISTLGDITGTYTEHFRRVFFGDTPLAELPDAPLLLINGTDLQSGADHAREVFFKKRAPAARFQGKSLDESLRVAQLVAASGAFPGAFRPATLPWPEPGADGSKSLEVKERQFVDGGVIDNLGVEGLRHYLTIAQSEGALPERPHVLIISDASAYGGPEGMSPRADAMTLLKRTTDYTYELLHRHIYARYTGRGDLFQWIRSEPVARQVGAVAYSQIDHRLGENGPKELLSVTVPSTASVMAEILARYRGCRIDDAESGEAVQKRVAGFATLDELSPREVEEAFWLGRVMGQIYAPAIDCARKRALGEQCQTDAAQAAQAVQCPSRRQVFQ